MKRLCDFLSVKHVIIHRPVKFGVHRTCGIRDITLLICDYLMKELRELSVVARYHKPSPLILVTVGHMPMFFVT